MATVRDVAVQQGFSGADADAEAKALVERLGRSLARHLGWYGGAVTGSEDSSFKNVLGRELDRTSEEDMALLKAAHDWVEHELALSREIDKAFNHIEALKKRYRGLQIALRRDVVGMISDERYWGHVEEACRIHEELFGGNGRAPTWV